MDVVVHLYLEYENGRVSIAGKHFPLTSINNRQNQDLRVPFHDEKRGVLTVSNLVDPAEACG